MTQLGRPIPHRVRFRIMTAALLAIAISVPARASAEATDPRWLPWIGCWMPTTATTEVAGSFTGTQRVCVIPADNAAGVDVVNLSDGQVVSRIRVDATGDRRPVSREGCEGWETSRFSENGGRVFIRSEMTCAGGVERVSTGVIAIASPSDWVDVEVVTVRDQRATRIVRYRSAPDTTVVDRQIAAALGQQEMARRAARMAAAALPTIADVIEASRHLDPAAVEAWLLQRMPRFTVDARELRQLARAHVPGAVIDLVVALSRPEMFADRFSTRGYTLVRLDAPRARVVAVESPAASDEISTPVYSAGGSVYEERSSYGSRCHRCSEPDIIYIDPTPNSPYGYYYPYWPYGVYPGYPYYPTYPYYPSYPSPQPQKPAPRPPVIVHGPSYPRPPATQPPPAPAPEVNGRAINGHGYTRSGGGTAAEPPAPQQAAPQPRGATEAKPRPAPPPAPQQAPPQQAPPPRTAPEAKPRPAPPTAPEQKPQPKPEQKPDAPARTAKPRPPVGG